MSEARRSLLARRSFSEVGGEGGPLVRPQEKRQLYLHAQGNGFRCF